MLGGARFGFRTTGKLGRAWHGAWVFGCDDVDDDLVGVGKLHGYTTWIGEDGLGEGQDGDGVEVIGEVSGCEISIRGFIMIKGQN